MPEFTSGQMFGFLNIYKPTGMTSHDVIAILRRVTKIKQIGHTGTLDPFAEGVLPVCIGKATRLIEYLDDEKEYLAQITFGKCTDTYDLDGKTTFEYNKKVNLNEVIEGLKMFEGEISQTPPIYSALKVNGKKLYEYARSGEEVKIESRKVTIEKIELKQFDEENQVADVLIKCSKGTYIRSIAHDLGQNLKVGGYLTKLVRTQAGKFFVDKATALDEIKTKEDVEKNLINPLEMLDFGQIIINDDEYKKILNGMAIENITPLTPTLSHKGRGSKLNSLKQNDDNFIILIYNDKISAIAQVNGNQLKIKKVFSA